MDKRFCVYLHFAPGEEHPFYVGEGTLKRAKSSNSRNRWWKFKVAKHGGFRVEILAKDLTKREAELLEVEVIAKYRKEGVGLVNICDGPMFQRHWLTGRPKEDHPMFGKTFEAPWIAESNKRRTGEKLKPRPDLSERNKKAEFKRRFKPVVCVETGQVFSSVKEAAASVNIHPSKISVAIKNGYCSRGFHWAFADNSHGVPNERQH